MLQFSHPSILWLTALIPLAGMLFVRYRIWRKKSLAAWGNPEVMKIILTGLDSNRHLIKFLLQITAFGLVVVALAGPRVPVPGVKSKSRGGDVMICLDISNSMLAEDMKPNRLIRTRQAISTLLRQLRDEQVGLILFAGEAYIQVPLTVDKTVATMLLHSAATTSAGNQGTAIADALSLAVRSFGNQEKDVSQTIVLFSDGEDHEGGVTEEARLAAERGILIYTVGVGNPEGVPIPVYEDGVLSGYRKDQEGNTIVSRLDPALLTAIAEATGGEFFLSDNLNAAVQKIASNIQKRKSSERENSRTDQYEAQYQWFLGGALILLAIDLLLTLRRNRRSLMQRVAAGIEQGAKISKQGLSGILLIIILMALPLFLHAQDVSRPKMRAGNKAYREGNYSEAERYYRKSMGRHADSPEGNYNLGTALYKQGKYQEAYDHYRTASSSQLDSLTRSKIYHNLGNASLQRYFQSAREGKGSGGDYLQKGIEAYSQALRYNPLDEDTRFNLSKALMLRKQQPPPPQQQQQQERKDQPQPESRPREGKDKVPEPPPPSGNLSREDAERILNAIKDKELRAAEQIHERERLRNATRKAKDW